MRDSDAGSYVCTVSSGSLSVMSNTATLTVYGKCRRSFLSYITFDHLGPPIIRDLHPKGQHNVVMGRNITFECRANGQGILKYTWEIKSSRRWTKISNINTRSYTTDTTLANGQYMYRCRVSNEAGSVVSNNAIVNVYGEYCPNM